MTTDSLGRFAFYAEDGRYQLVISGNQIATQTITDIQLGEETEGTFTFSDASGGTPVAGSSGGGNWIRQGSMVYVSGRWKWNSNSQTVAAVIDGLPFAAKSGLYAQCLEVASQGNTSYDGSHSRLFARIEIGGTKLYFGWTDIPARICRNWPTGRCADSHLRLVSGGLMTIIIHQTQSLWQRIVSCVREWLK